MVFVEKNDNKKLKRGFFLVPLAVIVLLAGLSYGIYYLWQSGIKDSPRIEIENPTIDKIREKIDPSPTSFPFRKLTIPYLREREYKSNLGEMQKIGETGSYESFVASFDSDGLKEYGLLTKPKGEIPAGGWPAVVFVHGYIPPKNYRTKVNYVSYVDQIAKNGLIVFKIDLRGHDQSEGEPGGGYYSGDYIIDTLNAVSALKNSDFVNPERIGLWGHSMAGNVTFRSFVASQKINAIVIWAGAGYTYEDLQDYAIDDNSYRPPAEDSEQSRKRRELRELYRGFDKKHWFWKQIIP